MTNKIKTSKTIESLNEMVNDSHNDEEIERLTAEALEYKTKYLKAAAEIENIRKRLMREKTDAVKFANEKFAKDLLETIDNFENSLKIEMDDNVREGVELTYKGLITTLNRHNIMECEADTFDPNYHQAVSIVVTDDETNTIVEVLRKGYVVEDRLLRPAMVVVSE